MRLLASAFILLLATAAEAGQKSRGNDLNNDGGPGDRRNAWELQRQYGLGDRPTWRYESRPSWRYEYSSPGRGYRSDRRSGDVRDQRGAAPRSPGP